MLSPEPPYPLEGGGAFRTASLLHYFARFAEVDLILISDSGAPALVPPGLLRSQRVIPLPHHSRATIPRYFRNARRAAMGVPPLIDRLAGLAGPIDRAIGGRSYDLGIVEHFWCAPYVNHVRACCGTTILDLHNIESVLHERCTPLTANLVRAGHARFAPAARALESKLLPQYSMVLVTSEDDAATARRIAPQATVQVYPNALPWAELPRSEEKPCIVFSANFEYHPNIDAVEFLSREIWPEIRRHYPEMKLRLVGRGDAYIRKFLQPDSGIEVTGPVIDARAEIAQATLVVAPLRAGSGTRIKILEAWAAGRAVVATPLAAEGLKARDGVNIVLGSNPAQFVSQVLSLLEDSAARQRLGASGRRTFEDNYCWDAAWKGLDSYLQLMP